MSTKSSTKYSVVEVDAAPFRLEDKRSDLAAGAAAAAAAADDDDAVGCTASTRLDAGSGRIVRCTIVH
jgi:hypothetical protein